MDLLTELPLDASIPAVRVLERLFDLALGLSIAGWGVSHLAGEAGVVRAALASVNLTVGLLISIRRPEASAGSFGQILQALPAVAIGGAALALAPDLESWRLGPAVLLATGSVVALLAFGFLGRSFAVLPSLRRVVVRGPYRLMRHPAYLGELTILAACIWSAGSWLGAPVVPLAIALVALRIRAEEQVLAKSAAYRAYRARVRWRLFPGLW